MSSIDRISTDAARTYVQNTDAASTAGARTSAQRASQADHDASASKADSVTLSDTARSLAAARQAVEAAPDVREQKVADIKQQVSDGTYQVSAQVLARKIVDASNNPS